MQQAKKLHFYNEFAITEYFECNVSLTLRPIRIRVIEYRDLYAAQITKFYCAAA